VKEQGTLLLTRRDVAALLTIEECIAAVERAFKLHGEGKAAPPGILGVHARGGGFHIKAGIMNLERSYFAAKLNANFPENANRFGLPTIQGVIALCDAENGYPLALMDSIEITVQRTGAATAVAAKYLARPDSKVATICGCGNQGRISLLALSTIIDLTKVFVFDSNGERAQELARDVSSELKIDIEPMAELKNCVRDSDIIITCTPSKEFFLKKDWIAPGTFVAAVGADSEEKQELDPALFSKSKVVVDLVEQCATIGELHHALAAGSIYKEQVHAELGEIVAGKKPGRTAPDEIIIFDSTGMALQDVAAATVVYEKAVNKGIGKLINLAE
jgi:ornithine cyclodeaminase/alanine dehydrogenase